jgi:hypothetical protein
MKKSKVLYADSSFENLMEFEGALKEVNATVVYGDCRTANDIITQ